MSHNSDPKRVLIMFGAVALYGMERSVIEIFDLLRPEVQPHFLISNGPARLGLPLFHEIQHHNFSYSFLSDKKGWERIGKPKSVRQAVSIISGVLRGNVDALRAIRHYHTLYLPNAFAAVYAIAAMAFCRLTRRRVVFHMHDLTDYPSRTLRLLGILITDFVHNSELGSRQTASANPFILAKRNFIIPIPISQRSHGNKDPNVQSEFLGKKNLIFVGQVASHKGIKLLLEAFEEIARVHEDVKLHIVGGGDDPNVLKSLTQRVSENSRIKYWGYRSDIFDFLQLSDIYVHPSPPSVFRESFGRGVVEAMSLGLPTVCFASGALQEIVRHEVTGLICLRETKECLAQNICRLLDDSALRKRCGLGARRTYEQFYSSAGIKASWLDLLRRELSPYSRQYDSVGVAAGIR